MAQNWFAQNAPDRTQAQPQVASKTNWFDANKPSVESMSQAPVNANSATSTPPSFLSRAKDYMVSMLPKAGDIPAAAGAAIGTAASMEFPPAIPFAAGAGAAIGERVHQLYQRFSGSEDYPKTATDALTRMAGQGLTYGASEAIPGLAQTHAANPGAVGSSISKAFVRSPETLMTRALGSSDASLQDRMPTIRGQLKEAEKVTGPINNVRKLKSAADRQFRVNSTQYRTEIIDPQRDVVVPNSRALDQMAQIDAIPPGIPEEERAAITSEIQSQGNKDFTIGELDQLRSDLGKGQTPRYNKKLSGQLQEDPTSKTISTARDKFVRNMFYDSLDRYGLGGSDAARELNNRIGAMIHIQDAVKPRINPSVAEQRPLVERGIRATVRATGDVASLGQLERFQNSLSNKTINSDIATAMKRWKGGESKPVTISLKPSAPVVPRDPYQSGSGYQPQGAPPVPEGLGTGPEDPLMRDPYTNKVRGPANPNLPVRVQGRQMPAYSSGDIRSETPPEVTTGSPLNKDQGGGISTPAGGKSVKPSGKSSAKLINVELDDLTGQPKYWVYMDPLTGKPFRSTVKLK